MGKPKNIIVKMTLSKSKTVHDQMPSTCPFLNLICYGKYPKYDIKVCQNEPFIALRHMALNTQISVSHKYITLNLKSLAKLQ